MLNSNESPSAPTPKPERPVITGTTPLSAGSPPKLPSEPKRKASPVRRLVTVLLSLCLGLFLADGVISLADDSMILFFNLHLLAALRGIMFLFAILAAIVIYGLMALTPMVPKRLFLPVTLFTPLAALGVIPFLIYFYARHELIACAISSCQVLCGLIVLRAARGGFKPKPIKESGFAPAPQHPPTPEGRSRKGMFHWPLVGEDQLGARSFSWLNLVAFLLANVFVLLPVVMVYVFVCAGLGVGHFSEGFLALRPDGLTVQGRKYVRDDGKTVRLYPMAHVGDASFYRTVSESFPTNSIILAEGVSDTGNLLTNKITYKRMATSLGLSEQQKEFKPDRGEVVRADVDVEEFGTNTINFLNLVMLIHGKGLKPEILLQLLQYTPPPHFEDQLWDDLLRNRNRHLLEELHARLTETDNIVVPWGAAHMPGIAEQIQKAGFRLEETREYVVIKFWKKTNG